MSQKLYRKESSGGVYTLNPQSHYVTLPSSTIDLWMPLIGAVGVGVYALYCRLAREGRVRGSDLKRMAKAARISDNTLRSLNRTLERIGFIAVEKPEGANRVRHYTTEIRLLEPPTRVPAELIRELECQSGYEIAAHWLVESAEAVLDTDTPPAPTLPQPRPQGGTGLGGTPQTFPQRTIPPLPQPRPEGNTSLGGLPQAPSQRTIPPLPQPRPQGNTGVGGVPQTFPQRTIPPLPQPRPEGNTSLGGTPQALPQRKIPPLPQPRPQGTGNASLGEVPAHFGNCLTNASSRLSVVSGGPVALSSVIESVYQRQIALNSAPHSATQRELTLNSAPPSAIQREPALNSAPGSAAKRVMEAPTSATLESLILNPLESENSPPPPIQGFSQTSDPEALTSPAIGEGGSRDGSA